MPFRYGDLDRQVVDLWLPKGASGALPVVVLIHGGYWRDSFDRTLMEGLAADCNERGWAAWNMEYRPSEPGGGWPETFLDIAAGIDLLSSEAAANGLDLDRVAVVGHSAGGTLALWAGARGKLPVGAPGAEPLVRPLIVVSQAGVNNLRAGAFERLGSGAVPALMKGEPEDVPEAYALASPAELLPLGVEQVIVFGTEDAVVPPLQSTAYAGKAAEAGDPVVLLTIEGGNHFAVIDPSHTAWKQVAAELEQAFD